MGLLNTLVYFCDHVCAEHCLVHLVCGVFFGLLLGHTEPMMAFWSATGVGFVKETIDYFKHHFESATFNYWSDPKYGIVDGSGDLLFWMIGGIVVYLLLTRSHRTMRKTLRTGSASTMHDNLANHGTLVPVLVPVSQPTVEQNTAVLPQ
jgi:hypothetical protein